MQGWPLLRSGLDVLIAAPTGSGKTLTAFLSCLDELLREAAQGTLADETRIVYVSPLKALGNDVQKNLLTPLGELQALAAAEGLKLPELRVLVRSGDTPQRERAAMVKRPPHILITTPESLYLYLTAERSRQTLRAVRTVVVDELHALARDKRGSHFALSMERLRALTGHPLQSVGLSATTRPLERLAAFLTGAPRPGRPPCAVVEIGHRRAWSLTVETPEDELTAVATQEMWGQVYDRLVVLSQTHRTMLVFANTRRLAERLAHDVGERLGKEFVAAHHGSMAKELRMAAEERLKAGSLKVMVATASLELGIDIGAIDLVVQLGTPRNIGVMLQRLGRSGHHKDKVSKGIIFAMTRDELVECVALVRAIREGRLDAVRMPERPLDVLAQQLIAEVAAQDWDEEALFDVVRRAEPYRELTRGEYEAVLHLVSEGVSTTRGRSRVHLHRDRVHGQLRARRGARLTALSNGGAIPDVFSYPVIAEPEDKQVGTVDEDFAVESMPQEVFVLGSTSWRIRRIWDGVVRVENAHGQAPTIPFWRGEAPARTDELSQEVSRLREDVAARPDAARWLEVELGLDARTAGLLARYVHAGARALSVVPTQAVVVAERFFDEAGGMQLVLHAPFGARINRAWGMALRKSFCRAFDFELQAAASDDGILLSLGEQHSFPLVDIFDFVTRATGERVLTQAVLQAPMFGTRFRWAAGRALLLTRMSGGKRVPPAIQRARAESLLAAVFPEQVGCQDNHGGQELELPDQPLVAEAMKDCLTDFMDLAGFHRLLEGLREGRIRRVAVDVPEPSVFAHQMVSSAPYTFLDDAPLEERRARAVSVRRSLPPEDAAAFGALDAAAIEEVVRDASPVVRDEEELHDALLQLGLLPVARLDGAWLEALRASGRAGVLTGLARPLAYAAERVPAVRALFPSAPVELAPLPGDGPVEREAAAKQVVRGWMEVLGPTTVTEVAELVCLGRFEVESAMAGLEAVGQVLRGHFRPGRPAEEVEWCDRRLLQRIHRLTVGRLRREIEPLSPQDFMRFLFRWQHVDPDTQLRGPAGVVQVVGQLEGFEAPAAAWETELLPARMRQYVGEWLGQACDRGEVAWGRLSLREPAGVGPRRGLVVAEAPARRAAVSRAAVLSFARRGDLGWLLQAARGQVLLADGPRPWPADLSAPARDVLAVLERRGASFFNELVGGSRRLGAEVEEALWELVTRGLITADAVQNLRVLQSPKLRRRQRALGRGGPGRWSLLQPQEGSEGPGLALEERLAGLFLTRYGIVFRDLLAREPLAPPWRELAPVYRRLEARGEVRGGRFLAGFAGEQFALDDAVAASRAVRRQAPSGKVVRVAAVDPLNLTGVVTPGARVAAVLGQSVMYVDGVPRSEVPVPGNANASQVDWDA